MCLSMIMRKQNMVKIPDCIIWIHIKTDDICNDFAENAETRFDTSSYELVRTFPKGKKGTWINERWTRQKIMAKFDRLREKT